MTRLGMTEAGIKAAVSKAGLWALILGTLGFVSLSPLATEARAEAPLAAQAAQAVKTPAPKPTVAPTTGPKKPVTTPTAVKKPLAAKPAIAKPATVAERVFAHLKTDLPLDPKVKIGRLANGMTYLIYPNKTPVGAVSMRLRVEAGGINETPEQYGAAHFLEHMAFLGSAHIAEGELIHILERHGLKFGADTNAFTTVNSTGYQLDLPRNDAESLDTGMLIMSDTAQALTLSPEAVDRERGVVLSEMRTRDTALSRAFKSRLKTLLSGQAYVDHEVIGTTESLKAMTAARLRTFYQTYYRPENITLIVTGDVDPLAIEAMVKARFASWKAVTPPPPTVKYGAYKSRGLNMTSYIEPGLPTGVTVSWFKPYDESISSRAAYKTMLMDGLITQIVGRRMASVNRDAAYEGIALSREDYRHAATGLTISYTPKPGQLTQSVISAYGSIRQFAAYADSEIYKTDFADAMASFNLAFKSAAAAADTRETSAIADELFNDIDSADAIMSPAQELALWNSLRAEVTQKEVQARMKTWIEANDPSIYYLGDKPIDLKEDTFAQHWELTNLMPPSEPAQLVKTNWPFTDFGPASALVSEEQDANFGFTRLTYANGLKVNIKPTKFKSDEILIMVRFEGGINRLSPTEPVPASLVEYYNANDLLRGGLGPLSGVEVSDALVGKNVSISLDLGEDYTDLDGSTSREDVLTQAQLMTAFLTQPRFDRFSVNSMLREYGSYYKSIQSSPEGLLGYSWMGKLYPNDTRYGLPDPAKLDNINEVVFTRFMSNVLKPRRMEVNFVGDITVAEAKAIMAQSFASLPAGVPETVKTAAPVQTPQKQFDLRHQGTKDQAAVMVLWPTEGFYTDVKRSRGLRLLGEVITLRLNSTLREKEGLAYSPAAFWGGSTAYDIGSILMMAGINPAQEDRFFKVINQITDDLKNHPITADELLRARQPVIAARLVDEKSNPFWMGMIGAASFEPKLVNAFNEYHSVMMGYQPQDLQILAQVYLATDRAVTLVARPELKAELTPAEKQNVKSAPLVPPETVTGTILRQGLGSDVRGGRLKR